MKNRIVISMGCAAALGLSLLGSGTAKASTMGEWLFDQPPIPPTFAIVNETPGGTQPNMQQPGVVYTNMQVAGGPFTNSVGMMRTPNSGNYVAMGPSVVNWTTKGQLTIEMWVNPSVYDAAADAIFVGGQGLQLVNTYSNGYYLQGVLFDGAGFHTTPPTSAKVFTNVWTHIAETYDGTMLRTYVNGVLNGSLSYATGSLANDGTGLTFDAYQSGLYNFHGSIDEVRISDVALPPGDGSGNGVLAWGASLVPRKILIEAESMAVDGINWYVRSHFDGYYDNEPSGGAMLCGELGYQGQATKTVSITQAGTYRVWVHYLDILDYYLPAGGGRAGFWLAVNQNGVGLGSQVFDATSVRTNAADQSVYGRFVWGSFDVALTNGNADVVLSKADPTYTEAALPRKVDCIVLSSSLTYVPDIIDFVEPLYLQVTMGPTSNPAVALHIGGLRDPAHMYPTYYITDSNISQDGLAVGACYTAGETLLTANTSSPWVNIAPLMSPVGDNHVTLSTLQDWGVYPSNSDFTVSFSAASMGGVFKTYSRVGGGNGMSAIINQTNHYIKADIDFAQDSAAAAAALPPMAGKRPQKFPVITGCSAYSWKNSSAVVGNEAFTLSTLGFNSIGAYDPAYFTNGFTKLDVEPYYLYQGLSNGCFYTVNVSSLRTTLSNQASLYITQGLTNNLAKWVFGDEIGSMSMDHIAACTNCQSHFTNYLSSQGLTPSFFGKTAWSQVLPTTNKVSSPREFYYTGMFRGRAMTDYLKLGTTNLPIATAPTTANFAEELTVQGNCFMYGVDWFDIFAQGGLRQGLTENWLPYTATFQLCGYRSDFLRAACGSAGRKFGNYEIISGTPWDSETKTVTDIGHGSQVIHHYNYGPYYNGGDTRSTATNYFPALKEVNLAIGQVEDYLVGATATTNKIALLYSHSTDIWTLDQYYSVSGKERMGIYLLLRHLGYPVDIVTEKDITAGKLDSAKYSALICNGSHLQTNAVPKLVSWLKKSGSTLYLGPGALTSNQFNGPLNFDTNLNITRASFVYDYTNSNPGRELYELPYRPNLMPVTYGTNTLEAVCGYQKVTSTGSGATVLATFADGSPAVFTKSISQGKLQYCGFFPGLAYQKGGVLTKLARDTQYANQGLPIPIYGSTDYPVAYRTLFAALQGTNQPPVKTTGSYLVEANRLNGPLGSVITLANWSGAALTNIQVTFAKNGITGTPFTVINPVRGITNSSGNVTVTMDLSGPCDFIVIRK